MGGKGKVYGKVGIVVYCEMMEVCREVSVGMW